MNINDALGQPIILKINDKEYKVAQLTQEIRANFTRYIEDNCLKTVQMSRKFLSEPEYMYVMSQHIEKVAAGSYDLFGTIGRGFLAEDVHAVHWLWVMLTKHQPGITKDEVDQLFCIDSEACFNALVESVSKKNLVLRS